MLTSKKHVNFIKKLSGHSGCEIHLVQNGDFIYVNKKAGEKSYNSRLMRQCKKQRLFLPAYNVYSPKIFESGYKDDLFFFNMEYVKGETLSYYAEYIKITEITDLIRCLFKILYWENAKVDKKSYAIFSEKINNLKNTLSEFDNLENAFVLLNNFDWTKVSKSPCHGDLTLENIIITNDKKLYLIDFLDSFYNSWMIDIAKLLQDLELKWSYRNITVNANLNLRLQVAKEALIEEILQTENGRENLDTIYHLLLLNIVRIYPYAKDKETLSFLDKSVEYLIKKLTIDV